MGDFFEFVGWFRSDPLRRRVGCDPIRVVAFNVQHCLVQPVILVVADDWSGQNVVPIAVIAKLLSDLLKLVVKLFFTHHRNYSPLSFGAVTDGGQIEEKIFS